MNFFPLLNQGLRDRLGPALPSATVAAHPATGMPGSSLPSHRQAVPNPEGLTLPRQGRLAPTLAPPAADPHEQRLAVGVPFQQPVAPSR